MPDAITPVRLCLDLNIWVADLLALHAGRTGTACQVLVDAVRRGASPLGPVQLVVSWGMLNRLETVLTRVLNVDRSLAQQYVTMIARYAADGPSAHAPYILLGSSGLLPLRDEEDGHVLDTACAGKASILVTRNFRDFEGTGTPSSARLITPGELAMHTTPDGHIVRIASPGQVVRWFKDGRVSSV